MADTGRDHALQQVREAENIVTAALDQPGLTTAQRSVLDDLSDFLLELDDFLLLNELEECAAELKTKAEQLKSINRRTAGEIGKLEEVAEKVRNVSRVIDACVNSFASVQKVIG